MSVDVKTVDVMSVDVESVENVSRRKKVDQLSWTAYDIVASRRLPLTPAAARVSLCSVHPP
jgi:hypothetical protein